MARYNTDGSLDTSFSIDGKVTFDLGGSDQADAVAIQSDGKIVAAGFTAANNTADFALVRLTTGGAIDTSSAVMANSLLTSLELMTMPPA